MADRVRSRDKGRRGQALVEFALAFSIFLLLFLGICQFAILHHYRLVLGHASREGARAAATKGGQGYIADEGIREEIVKFTIQHAPNLNPPLTVEDIAMEWTEPSGGQSGVVTMTISYDLRPKVPLIAPLLPEKMATVSSAAMRLEN